MREKNHLAEALDVDGNLSDKKPPEIWNPKACVLWSLLFTPVFGSILIKKNWQTLNDEGMTEKSDKWLIASFIFLIPGLSFFPVAFCYFIIWYFLSPKEQLTYVQEKLNNEYYRKSWKKPLIIGFAIVSPIILSMLGLVLFLLYIITAPR